MRQSSEHCFDVYVGTNTAMVTLVREVSWRTAQVIARHHADTRRQPVFIRSCATRAVETIGPETP